MNEGRVPCFDTTDRTPASARTGNSSIVTVDDDLPCVRCDSKNKDGMATKRTKRTKERRRRGRRFEFRLFSARLSSRILCAFCGESSAHPQRAFFSVCSMYARASVVAIPVATRAFGRCPPGWIACRSQSCRGSVRPGFPRRQSAARCSRTRPRPLRPFRVHLSSGSPRCRRGWNSARMPNGTICRKNWHVRESGFGSSSRSEGEKISSRVVSSGDEQRVEFRRRRAWRRRGRGGCGTPRPARRYLGSRQHPPTMTVWSSTAGSGGSRSSAVASVVSGPRIHERNLPPGVRAPVRTGSCRRGEACCRVADGNDTPPSPRDRGARPRRCRSARALTRRASATSEGR